MFRFRRLVSVVCAVLLLGQGLAAAAALPFACAGAGVEVTWAPTTAADAPAHDHSHAHVPVQVPDDSVADLMDAHCGGHGTGTGHAPHGGGAHSTTACHCVPAALPAPAQLVAGFAQVHAPVLIRVAAGHPAPVLATLHRPPIHLSA